VTTVGISDERPNEPRRLRRDMAKIGQLVLDRGRWNGERVVSETWIKAATAPQIKTSKRRRYARNILPPGSGPALLEPSHGVSHQVARVRPVIKHSGDRAIPPLKHGPDIYAKKVLLPLAFLPIPSIFVVAPSNLVQCVYCRPMRKFSHGQNAGPP
jgi:hypothetical protein